MVPATAAPPRHRVAALLAVVGALAGIAAKAADESPWSWAADLGTFPAAWVLAVAVIGRQAPGPLAAALRASAFFAAMSVAYYAWAALVLGFGWTWLLGAWLVLSATAVPAAAVAAQWATRRPGAAAGLLVAAAAGLVLGSGGALRLWYRLTGTWQGPHVVQGVVDVLVALALVLLLPRHRSTRVWAVVLALPMAWLAGRGLDVFYAVVG
jgi:Family of unknown function (DUF6518)